MRWTIEYSSEAERDFELILDHLDESYRALGEERRAAFERAVLRLGALRAAVDRLGQTPFIGTLRPDIYPGLRFLRRDGAAVWFLPLEERRAILVLALFFGGQEHIRRMMTRLLA